MPNRMSQSWNPDEADEQSGDSFEHRRGGQEPPEEVQDRPEQNAGYDAAVRQAGGSSIPVRDEAEVVDITEDTERRKDRNTEP